MACGLMLPMELRLELELVLGLGLGLELLLLQQGIPGILRRLRHRSLRRHRHQLLLLLR